MANLPADDAPLIGRKSIETLIQRSEERARREYPPELNAASSRDIGTQYDEMHDRSFVARTPPIGPDQLLAAFNHAHIGLKQYLTMQEIETAGCTASVLTYDPLMQQIHTAQLGDSSCGACIISPDQNVRIVRLTDAQTPSNDAEVERINTLGGEIEHGKLSVKCYRIFDVQRQDFEHRTWHYRISTTGGFGDLIFGDVVRRKPIINTYNLYGDPSRDALSLSLSAGDRLIVYSETDGTDILKDPAARAEAIKKALIDQGKPVTPQSLVEHFCYFANQHGTRDNKFPIAVEIDLSGLLTPCFAIGSCDGHGGELLDGKGHHAGQLVSASVCMGLFTYLSRDIA